MGKHLFAICYPHNKEELEIINATCNLYLYYSSDKLMTIASMYHLKAFFNPFYATQTIKFLSDNQALSNKQLEWQVTNQFCGLYYIKLNLQDTNLLS